MFGGWISTGFWFTRVSFFCTDFATINSICYFLNLSVLWQISPFFISGHRKFYKDDNDTLQITTISHLLSLGTKLYKGDEDNSQITTILHFDFFIPYAIMYIQISLSLYLYIHIDIYLKWLKTVICVNIFLHRKIYLTEIMKCHQSIKNKKFTFSHCLNF